jgi:hypothetical protein
MCTAETKSSRTQIPWFHNTVSIVPCRRCQQAHAASSTLEVVLAGFTSQNGSVHSASATTAESAAAPHTLQLIATAAGHSLGGAVWQLSLVDQDFVYAVSINTAKDAHLRGCSIHVVRVFSESTP